MRISVLLTMVFLGARTLFPQTMNTLLHSGGLDSCLLDDVQKITFTGTGSSTAMNVNYVAGETDTIPVDSIRKIFFDPDGVVPVVLSSFFAGYREGHVQLSWTTQSEQDNLGWNILRSTSYTGPFTKVNTALVPGAGTTALPHEYSWVDETAAGAGYFYQLEQIDLSGGKEYSWVVSPQAGPADIKNPRNIAAAGTGVAPNPVSGPVSIGLVTETGGHVTVGVYDLTGSRLVKIVTDTHLAAGSHTVQWDGRDGAGRQVENGTYIVKVNIGTVLEIAKITLVHGGGK